MSARENNGIAKLLAILVMFLMSSPIAYAQDLIVPQTGSDPVIVRGADNPPSEGTLVADMLQVFVGSEENCCSGKTPIAGRHTVEGNTITFEPAFGFEAGQDYVAHLKSPTQDDRYVAFRIPVDQGLTQAAVTEIFPSGETLPENVLRFYIHFSTPMQPHVAFDYVKLRDATGKTDNAAFMRFKQELWNKDRTRLTVLIDPGRIKREVATNRALGPALRAGQRYTLSVDGGWTSADGTSAIRPFSKPFLVTEPLRSRPDVTHWTVSSPCAGTREPLVITFDRPFDRHFVARGIRLTTKDAVPIHGTIAITDGEHVWHFIPDKNWSPNTIMLTVNPDLEDVAANNFRDLLDHEADDQAEQVSSTTIQISPKSCAE